MNRTRHSHDYHMRSNTWCRPTRSNTPSLIHLFQLNYFMNVTAPIRSASSSINCQVPLTSSFWSSVNWTGSGSWFSIAEISTLSDSTLTWVLTGEDRLKWQELCSAVCTFGKLAKTMILESMEHPAQCEVMNESPLQAFHKSFSQRFWQTKILLRHLWPKPQLTGSTQPPDTASIFCKWNTWSLPRLLCAVGVITFTWSYAATLSLCYWFLSC